MSHPRRSGTKAERDEQRREQIIEAARTCVVRRGFHAASMADIAATATMSVGQIYRYFPGKDAIIHALVEQIVQQRLDRMNRESWTAFASALAHRGLDRTARDRDDRVLLLEVTAEATRNPAVAELMRATDRALRERAIADLKQADPTLTTEQADARVEYIAVLFEGTSFRHATDPPLDVDELERLYKATMKTLIGAAGKSGG